jgi:hypothetical protein
MLMKDGSGVSTPMRMKKAGKAPEDALPAVGRLIIDASADRSSAAAALSLSLTCDRRHYQLWGTLAGSGTVGQLRLGHSPLRVTNVD